MTGLKHSLARLLPVVLVLLVVSCSSEDDDDETPVTESDATAEETATPTPEEHARAVDEAPDATPAAQEADEWLETAPTFQGAAYGPENRVYVGYPRHAAILVLSLDGDLIDAWGEEVRIPNDIAAGAETIYAADMSQINRYDLNGAHLGIVGEFGFEPGQLAEPFGIAQNSDGDLFVTEAPGGALKKFSPEGEFIEEWAEPGEGAVRPGTYLASDSADTLYLFSQADQDPFHVEVRTTDQNDVDEWEVPAPELDDEESNRELLPMGIAVGGDDLIHVATVIVETETESREMLANDYQVSTFDQQGDLVASWRAVADAGVDEPLARLGGMTATDSGDLILVDSGPDSHRIQRFSADGDFVDEWELDVPAFLCDFGPDEFEGLTC